jgi:endo-1,4-beta-xylanase
VRTRPRRTAVVVALALAVAGSLAACGGHHRDKPSPAQLGELAALAHQRGIAIGTEFVQSRYDSSYYRDQVATSFTSITPNRSFKWRNMEPAQGTFDFDQTDTIMAYAAAHHLRVRACCLAWGVGMPTWLQDGHWTKAQAKSLLHEFINKVVGRYKGQIAEWDVVNEGLKATNESQRKNYTLASTFWGKLIGPEYVVDAFTWAHQADPSAELFYNDYGAEAPSHKFDAELKMVTAMKAHGVPISGVGLQTHRPPPPNGPPYYPTQAQVTNVLTALASHGLHSEITELDQPLPLMAGTRLLNLQATLYGQMVKACLAVAMCTGVTVWGLDDKDRYQQLVQRDLGVATLFSTDGVAKPSFYAVVAALRDAPGPAAARRASPGPSA